MAGPTPEISHQPTTSQIRTPISSSRLETRRLKPHCSHTIEVYKSRRVVSHRRLDKLLLPFFQLQHTHLPQSTAELLQMEQGNHTSSASDIYDSAAAPAAPLPFGADDMLLELDAFLLDTNAAEESSEWLSPSPSSSSDAAVVPLSPTTLEQQRRPDAGASPPGEKRQATAFIGVRKRPWGKFAAEIRDSTRRGDNGMNNLKPRRQPERQCGADASAVPVPEPEQQTGARYRCHCGGGVVELEDLGTDYLDELLRVSSELECSLIGGGH